MDSMKKKEIKVVVVDERKERRKVSCRRVLSIILKAEGKMTMNLMMTSWRKAPPGG